MIDDLAQVAKLMNAALVSLYEDGEIEPDSNGDLIPDNVWPWKVADVVGVHLHMIGVGDGVWIRLKDDTVWNVYGEQIVDSRHSQFDTVDN